MNKKILFLLPLLFACNQINNSTTENISSSLSNTIISSESLISNSTSISESNSDVITSNSSKETEAMEVNFYNNYSAIEIATNNTRKEELKSYFNTRCEEIYSSKAFLDFNGIRLGSSSNDGSITFALNKNVASYEIFVHSYIKSYVGDDNSTLIETVDYPSVRFGSIKENTEIKLEEKIEESTSLGTYNFTSYDTKEINIKSFKGRIVIDKLIINFYK